MTGNVIGSLLISSILSLVAVVIGAIGYDIFSTYRHKICWMFFAISMFFCFCSICFAFYAGGVK